jgi:HTH-type transcriptional regulator / antitoxin HigA
MSYRFELYEQLKIITKEQGEAEMSDTLTPARAIPPGHILQRELDAWGWTQKDLSDIIDRPPQAINEIIQGTKQITPETARELSAAFGNTRQFWTNLETN